METLRGGYKLDGAVTDLSMFRQRCEAARCAPDPAVELRELKYALELWKGTPFQSLEDREWLADTAVAIEEERLQAVERLLDLLLEQDDPRGVIRLVGRVQADHPFRESLWRRYLQALHTDGRTAEALLRYAELRELLADQLGVDPSAPMQALHQRLLVAEADDRTSDGSDPVVARPAARPAPGADVRVPVARGDEIEALNALLADPHRPTAVVLDGPGGVGKTSIARHWAHTTRFRGGVVEVPLGAVHGERVPTTHEALAEILRTIGMSGDEIPGSTDARRRRYLEETSRNPVLLLLDDAAGSAQVRPLLPGPGSLAVITSRSRLSGLVLDDTARRLSVTRLGPHAGAALLRAAGGSVMTEADEDVLRDLSRCCEGLPLALRIVIEVVDRACGVSLPGLVDALRQDEDALDLLDLGDEALSVRAVLGLNRRLLGPVERALLVQIARCGMTEFDLEDVRRIAVGSGTSVRVLLNRLVAVNVLEQRGFGRFRLGVLHRAVALAGRPDEARDHAVPVGS